MNVDPAESLSRDRTVASPPTTLGHGRVPVTEQGQWLLTQGSSWSEEKTEFVGKKTLLWATSPGFSQQASCRHRLFYSPIWPLGVRSVSHTWESRKANSESISFHKVLGTMVPSQKSTELLWASVNDNNLPPPLFIKELNLPRVLKTSFIWTLPGGNPEVHFKLTLSSGHYYSSLVPPHPSANKSF